MSAYPNTSPELDPMNLFPRAKNALAILGTDAHGQWGDSLRLYMGYEDNFERLREYRDFLVEIERICKGVEMRELERQRKAMHSQHVGEQGKRQSFVARVDLAITMKPREGQEDFGDKHLTILSDADGNVLKYWNQIKVPAPSIDDPDAKRPAEKGERVSFDAMVAGHGEYKGVKQTDLQRATKGKLVV